mmetsp:Transcript_24582/g.56714  ORF Transcript_24582/g.56714 Transcript_24582/m.56714 type:complete len:126 (-) Transcript_24582:202-579(-)
MGFACYARTARCRASHLSSWARRTNMCLDGHRSLASASVLLRACSEVRPAGSFPEQRLVACGSEVSVGAEMEGEETDLVTIIKEAIERMGATDGLLELRSSYTTKWTLGSCVSSEFVGSMHPRNL